MAKSTAPKKSKASIESINVDIAKQAVAQFLEYLDQGGNRWDSGHTQASFDRLRPINFATGKEYSGYNVLALGLASPYASNRWITAKQLGDLRESMAAEGVSDDKLPFIRLGEKASVGIFSKPMPRSSTKINDATGEEETRSWTKNMNSRFWVFNAEQIENCPGAELVAATGRPHEPTAALEQAVDALKDLTGLKVIYGSQHGNFYRPASDEIHLVAADKFKTQYDHDGTLGHEVGHSLAAKHRCDESDALANRFGDKAYSHEELRAEIFSLLLSLDLGIRPSAEHIKNHAAYVEHWKKNLADDPQALLQAFSKADSRLNKLREIVHEHCRQRDIEPMIAPPRAAHERAAAQAAQAAPAKASESAPEAVEAPSRRARTKARGATLEMAR